MFQCDVFCKNPRGTASRGIFVAYCGYFLVSWLLYCGVERGIIYTQHIYSYLYMEFVMDKFEEVTVYEADGVPSGGTASGSEVPSGTPAQETGDAINPADVLGQLKKLEEDRRAQQSVYDRKLAEAEKRNRELAQKLEQIQVQGMDEAQKVVFERDQLRAQLEQVQARQRISEYADAFCQEFGVDKAGLDMTNEETIAMSGWQLVSARVKELEQRASQPPTAQKPAPQNNTKVITGSGGVPRTAMTQTEFMTRIAQSQGKTAITPDEFYQWAERNPDQFNQWLIDQSTE